VNEAVVVKQQEILEHALSTDPKTQKALQKLIRQVILEARAKVVNSIQFQNGDPRRSRQAVRTSVYKQILGANINIYNSKRRHGTQNYTPPRTLRPGQRGGNRRPQSQRTIDLQSYAPEDRGFILRFVNDGTNDRVVPFTPHEDRKPSKWNKHPNTGNRGRIGGTNFFGLAGERAMTMAADTLADLIDAEFEKIMSNN